MNKVAQKRQSIPIIGGDQIHLVTNFSKVGGGAWEVVFVDPDDAVDNAASYEQKTAVRPLRPRGVSTSRRCRYR